MSLSRVAAACGRVVDVAGTLAALCCIALVLVMASNVLLRYGFALGSVWAQELEWHLLAPICLLGMAYSVRHAEHVRVDILFTKYSDRGKLVVDLVSAVLFLAVALIVIVLSWRYVGQSWRVDEGSANPGGIPWRWALKALLPLGFAIFALQALAEALVAIDRLRR